jgi:hypothetical protein
MLTPRAGERQRHVGLGFAAEIDRAVVDLVRHGLGEARLLGHVVAAADHFHGQPRHLQLLVAAGVDLGEFGDRRHLAQEPQRVEASLLKRAGRPRQLRGPADLAFDFADELPDLAGRCLRLLALDADQRGLLLLIREVDVERAVGDERQADDGDEQRDVFDEQPAAHDRCAGGRSDAAQAARQPAYRPAAMIRQRSHAIIHYRSAPCAKQNLVPALPNTSGGRVPLRLTLSPRQPAQAASAAHRGRALWRS